MTHSIPSSQAVKSFSSFLFKSYSTVSPTSIDSCKVPITQSWNTTKRLSSVTDSPVCRQASALCFIDWVASLVSVRVLWGRQSVRTASRVNTALERIPLGFRCFYHHYCIYCDLFSQYHRCINIRKIEATSLFISFSYYQIFMEESSILCYTLLYRHVWYYCILLYLLCTYAVHCM